jgi:methionyl-tRNA formyltransferase
MNIILCGYHWTGCSALKQLLAEGHRVHVFTHESPYHVPSLIEYCRATSTPYSLEDISRAELPFQPDAIASIYYRNLIKQHVIDACGKRIFNLHPSLLPVYRGCSSLTWAMIQGEKQAGYTFHYIDRGCDTGKILIQKPLDIEPWDTQATLFQRVQFEAMKDFLPALKMVLAGEPGREQVGTPSMYRRGCPHEGQIDPSWPLEKIERFIRAMVNPPYPPAKLGDQEIYTIEEYLRASQQPDTAVRNVA